jgi:ArsR family transcriptional regulator, lead/cadmium/zinc/bismuth-responsive transcriptional repressor
MKAKKPNDLRTNLFDKDKVRRVKNNMKSEEFFHDLAGTFKAMSDPTRAKIIYALCRESELCVHDIAAVVGTTNSAISHQLRTLRDMKLVRYKKAGKITYYSLDDIHINNLFDEGMRHVEEK